MAFTVYNTLTKNREAFVPQKPGEVAIYTCGPTVYNSAHIGNLRAYVFEDVLKRVLLLNGYAVKHVMNITDVGHLASDADEGEDKMTKGLRREGLPLTRESMKMLAEKYTNVFNADLKKLNILPPTLQPKASEHIAEDLELISSLEKKGFAYPTSDGVYFDTSKVKDYGKLAPPYQEADEHARIKRGEKKHPRDFALWKFNKDLGWDAPFGKGFPGWHIECSAMASKYLGKQFDIHCGGKEHIPVHHTNEIAQSEAAWGKKPWVKYWLHHEWLELGGEKMAKSGENFITLSTLEEKGFHPLDFRYLCLGTHYRKPLMFSYEALEGARQAHRRLVERYLQLKRSTKGHKKVRLEYWERFIADVNDDLNTPKALATMWDMLHDDGVKEYEKYSFLLRFDAVLGLRLKEEKPQVEKIPAEVMALAKERLEARKRQDWKKADQLRGEIRKLGYIVGDTKEGFELTKG